MKVLERWLAADTDARRIVLERTSSGCFEADAATIDPCVEGSPCVPYVVGDMATSIPEALEKLDDALSSEAGSLLHAEGDDGN